MEVPSTQPMSHAQPTPVKPMKGVRRKTNTTRRMRSEKVLTIKPTFPLQPRTVASAMILTLTTKKKGAVRRMYSTPVARASAVSCSPPGMKRETSGLAASRVTATKQAVSAVEMRSPHTNP